MARPVKPIDLQVGRRLQAIRQAQGLSQTQFASRAHTARSVINQSEQGRRGILVSDIYTWANVLEVSPAALLVDADGPTQKDQVITAALRDITTAALRDITTAGQRLRALLM